MHPLKLSTGLPPPPHPLSRNLLPYSNRTVEALTTSLNEMTTTLDELRASSSGRIKGLESAVQHLKANMIDEIASVGIYT